MSEAIEVIDRNGNRVLRANGILQDGDHLRTIRMHDHAIPPDPRLAAAMAAADRTKRAEAFQAARHQPGYGLMDAATAAQSDRLYDERNAKLSRAWKAPIIAPQEQSQRRDQPPPPTPKTTQSHDDLVAARDRRLSEAWRG